MADFNFIVDQGVIVPDTSTIRTQVEAEWRAQFGADLVTTPETPQGIFITQDTETRDGVARNNAEIANKINPDLAGGIWIDAIWSLTGGARNGATRSILNGVILTGSPSTIVPAGSAAIVSETGQRFLTVSEVTIGVGGTVTVQMIAEEYGPIAVGIEDLDRVASSVLGWEQVLNPSAAIIGRNEESDIASRQRRRNTLALQSISSREAIISRLYALEGVQSLIFRENIYGSSQIIDGMTLVSHSIWVCVNGGTNADIAQALLDSKTDGANWNGAVIVNVTDEFSGQIYPVKFDRPTEQAIYIRVTIRQTTLDYNSVIPSSILSYAAGEINGEEGFVVGSGASPFEISAAINSVEPRIFVTKVEFSLDGMTWSTNNINSPINQILTIDESNITVVVL